jgi:ABC-type Zn2+ transport system substrate-binding protein/surface adhesin
MRLTTLALTAAAIAAVVVPLNAAQATPASDSKRVQAGGMTDMSSRYGHGHHHHYGHGFHHHHHGGYYGHHYGWYKPRPYFHHYGWYRGHGHRW